MSKASAVVSTSNRWLTTIWNASTGANLLHRGTDCRLKLLRRALPAYRKRAVEGSRGGQRGRGRGQSGSHGIDPGDRFGVRLIHALVGRVEVDGVRDQPHLAVVVVQHRKVGGEQEGQLRNVEISRIRVGQTFDSADRVVAQVADHARSERRHTVGRRRVQQPQRLGQGRKRVATSRQADRSVAQPADLTSLFSERCGRPDTDEGIPRPDSLLGRLEEVGARQVRRQLGVEADGTFAVGKKAAKDRNHPAFDGELAELLQRGGEIADHVCRSGPLSRRASKQVRSPVWQATPTWWTRTSTVSPSQSNRTSRTSWVLPLLSPFTQ